MTYDRAKAVEYARKWALKRNPNFYSFDGIGGDCTNFASQCLYAGCGVMNYTQGSGWYYRSPKNRAPAWTGVEFLHRFLLSNKGRGPYACELALQYAQPGDIIQLSPDGRTFSHSIVIVSIQPQILVSAHSDDSDNRPLDSYQFNRLRLLHIEGARK